ncbi:MAG: Hsp20/alpha crystallin family protein [Victivallales bacterium]|nr:Hsp20/alpha crystallin family protein [Victivallales bacterium]
MKEQQPAEYITYTPATDVMEQENGWSLCLDVPGAANELLEINVDDNILKIKADTTLQEHGMTVRFERSFQLSDEVNAGGIAAVLKNGQLKLTLPKAEAAKPHKIKVLTAE